MAREAGQNQRRLDPGLRPDSPVERTIFERGNFLVRSVYGAKETFGYTLTNSWVPF